MADDFTYREDPKPCEYCGTLHAYPVLSQPHAGPRGCVVVLKSDSVRLTPKALVLDSGHERDRQGAPDGWSGGLQRRDAA
jgi:hypothetical protein